MKLLTLIFITLHTYAIAQGNKDETISFDELIVNDTIDATTAPVIGWESFQKKLELSLNKSDTVGRKYKIRFNNIGYIVSKTGTIDSAWIIYHRRPIHTEIIKELKATRWTIATKIGEPIASRQQLGIHLYLTKAALKRTGYWPSFGERLLFPWIN